MFNQFPKKFQVNMNQPLMTRNITNMATVSKPAQQQMVSEPSFSRNSLTNNGWNENWYNSRLTNHYSDPAADNLSQKRLSEYFKETKKFRNPETEGNVKPRKSLKDLHKKYDNFYSQTIYMPSTNPYTQVNDRGSSQKSNVQVIPFRSTVLPKSQSAQKSEMKFKVEETTIKDLSVPVPKMIHLIGYVENIIRWNNMLKNTETYVLYNVLGNFIISMKGTNPIEKIVFLRGNNGTVLECSFFEIDKVLPKLIKGQFVACFGRIVGDQKYHFYSLDVLTDDEFHDCQRAIFFCQRKVNELHATHLKKVKAEEHAKQQKRP